MLRLQLRRSEGGRFSEDLFLLFEYLVLSTEPAQFFLLLGSEFLTFASVNLVLLDPVAQCRDANAEFCSYPGYGVILVRSTYQPDRLTAKLR